MTQIRIDRSILINDTYIYNCRDDDFGEISKDSCNTIGGIWHGTEIDEIADNTSALCKLGVIIDSTAELTIVNNKKIKLINVAICVLIFSFLNAQDNENDYVVTFTKSSLKPMAQVEDGTGAERKELFEEFARKMNPLTPELKMSMTLGHYWTGVSTDVLAINAYESIADADKVNEDGQKTRERAWRRDDVREEFFKNYDKYWVGGHTDMEIFRMIPDRTKTRKRKPKENTVITITTHYVAPLSEVEGGSAEERSELFDKFFEDVEYYVLPTRIMSTLDWMIVFWAGGQGKKILNKTDKEALADKGIIHNLQAALRNVASKYDVESAEWKRVVKEHKKIERKLKQTIFQMTKELFDFAEE